MPTGSYSVSGDWGPRKRRLRAVSLAIEGLARITICCRHKKQILIETLDIGHKQGVSLTGNLKNNRWEAREHS